MDFKDQCTREIVRTSTAVVEIRYSLYLVDGTPVPLPFLTEVFNIPAVVRERKRAQTQLDDLNDLDLLDDQRQVLCDRLTLLDEVDVVITNATPTL